MGYTKGTAMENIRKLMQFYFLTESGTSDHYHQNPELFYILKGTLEVKIDDKVYELRQEDIVLINANKRHTMVEIIESAEETGFGYPAVFACLVYRCFSSFNDDVVANANLVIRISPV